MLPEHPPCNVGLGMEEGEGILAAAPAAAGSAEKGCGLGREGGQSLTAGLWGSPVVTPGCCMEILQSSKGAVP